MSRQGIGRTSIPEDNSDSDDSSSVLLSELVRQDPSNDPSNDPVNMESANPDDDYDDDDSTRSRNRTLKNDNLNDQGHDSRQEPRNSQNTSRKRQRELKTTTEGTEIQEARLGVGVATTREPRRRVTRKQQNDSEDSVPSKFAPMNLGKLKQERKDYESDVSYEGLGTEFKRTKLLTIERKETLVPVSANLKAKGNMKTVDFDKLAAEGNTPWGSEAIFEKINESDISTLVGLATTYATQEEADPLRIGSDKLRDQNPKMHNPLLMLSYGPPLPPSYMKYIQSRAILKINQNDSDGSNFKRNFNSSCTDSAAVAIGMALEEAVTASLLPLAGLHVLRCRALEDMTINEGQDGVTQSPLVDCSTVTMAASSYSKERRCIHPISGQGVSLDLDKIKWKQDNPFDDWTLPPEEAIMKLLDQGMIDPFTNNFLSEPSRIFNSNAQTQKNQQNDVNTMWSKRYNVSPEMIAFNQELFGIFMTRKKNTS